MNSNLLSHATVVASEMLSFTHPADVVLSHFFRQHPKLGQRERAEIAEILFALLRHLEKIHFFLGKDIQKNPRMALLCALISGRGTSISALSGFLNETETTALTQFKSLRETFTTHLHMAAELPQWVIDKLRGQYDDAQILTLGRALAQSAPLDVRVNTLKSSRDKVLVQLQSEGFQAAATPFAPHGIRFTDKITLNRHPLFLNGTLEVQDEGSQLLALLSGAKRGEMVVDFCAGAGGKTLAIGAMMQNSGRLYAFDVSAKRLSNLKPRLAKSGLSNVHPQLIDHENDKRIKRLTGKCDCVLVDAPCSGLGTLRRNPDLKYRQSPASIARTVHQQASILRAAADLVKNGGRLIYATCSLLDEENTSQINKFISEQSGFEVADCKSILNPYTDLAINGKMLHLTPPTHQTDGFFAAVLHKKDKS